MIKVSPSILSADFANLGADVKKVVDMEESEGVILGIEKD